MSFTVAIIGKPNVGKSTLFNKLCGRRLAITDDRPGVTRDCKVNDATILDINFQVVDTAGLEKPISELSEKMVEKTMNAAGLADVIFFMVDARHGISGEDKEFARKTRKLNKKVILLANKSEGKKGIDLKDLYSLGFGDAIYISAEHNLGFSDLYYKLKELEIIVPPAEEMTEGDEEVRPLRLAIVGRPNVGKSTIFNCIIGHERSIVSDVSGTTRDAINEFLDIDGRQIELIDTAGMRKKANITDRVEGLSVGESINAMRRAHVVAIVIDAQQPLEKQDLSIARIAIEEGKALVLVINKCDLIVDRQAFSEELDYLIERNMFEVKGITPVYISAKNNKNIKGIFKAAQLAEEIWKKELSTSQLNQWLKKATANHTPPVIQGGRRMRLKYITQTGAKPPTFTIFCNSSVGLAESYNRYLYNSLREDFDLDGVPIRIRYRKNDNNPYDA